MIHFFSEIKFKNDVNLQHGLGQVSVRVLFVILMTPYQMVVILLLYSHKEPNHGFDHACLLNDTLPNSLDGTLAGKAVCGDASLLVVFQVFTCLTTDKELPVKVEAAVALQYLIKNQPKAETFIQPHVREIIKVIIHELCSCLHCLIYSVF